MARSAVTPRQNDAESKISKKDLVTQKLKISDLLSYSLFIEEKTKDFAGRKWLFESCEQWLSSKNNDNFLWINGASGLGKSTFVAKLLSRRTTCNIGAYFCKYDEEITRYASTVIRAIAHYLNQYYFEYADLIIEKVTETGFDELNAQKLFEHLVYSPTKRISQHDKCLCIVIDAIDELIEDEQNQLLTLFVKYSIPSWIKIILTSRPETYIYNILNQNVKTINLSDEENNALSRNDVSEYIQESIKEYNLTLTDDEIMTIIDKSENNFLYIFYLIKEVISLGEFNVNSLPHGLGALYLFNLQRKYPNDSDGIRKYSLEAKPIFEIMVIAKSSVTINELCSFLGISRSDFSFRMRKLSSFIVNINTDGSRSIVGKKIYHRSFAEWLTADQDNEYYVDTENGSKRILDYLLSNTNEFLANQYLKQCALSHIIDKKRSDVLSELLECDDMHIFESIENDLFYEYIERPKAVSELLKAINSEKTRRILITTFRKALSHGRPELLEEIVKLLRHKQETIRANMLEGEAFQARKEYELAESKFNDAREMAEREFAKNQSLWEKRHIGLCYNRLGNLAKERGDVIASKSFYSLSYKIFSEIVSRLLSEGRIDLTDPHHYEYMRDLMVCTLRIGDINFESNIDISLKHYTEYNRICMDFLTGSETLEMKRRLSIGFLRMGDVYLVKNNPIEAYSHYYKALERLIELKDDLPEEETDERYIIIPVPLQVAFTVSDNSIHTKSNNLDLPRERKELDFLHDLSLCYIRLGDAAKLGNHPELMKKWYSHYLRLCEFLQKTRRTNESEVDFDRAKKRMEKI